MTTFTFKKPRHKYPLLPGEKAAFTVRERPAPSVWAEKNLTLAEGAYTYPGRLVLHPWQKYPLDLIQVFDKVIYCGPVQSGKSLLADIIMFYAMAVLGTNGLIAYAENETVKEVFKVRIKTMIEKNKCLRDLWDGVEDNLTIDNILLRSCFWRVGSAQNKNSLATFPAGVVIGSEVGKWRKMDYNPVQVLYGRQESYPQGLKKSILESSPYDVGDYFYQEIYKSGVIILEPHYPCPVCGKFQVLTDSQIKVRIPESGEEPNHDPARIRADKEKAVYYECIHCKQEIREKDRPEMDKRVIWAAPEIIEEEVFKQKAETVTLDGKVISDRSRYDTACCLWNRLVDINFTFSECLARFFESLTSPEKRKTYENETMARFSRKKNNRVEISYLETKKENYRQNEPDAFVPDDVLIITAGIDSMDQDFYCAVQGWGPYLSSWILRHGKYYCPITDNLNLNKETMLNGFIKEFFSRPFVKRDGTVMPVRLGFIDRGGHRPDDVDYIVSKIGFLHAYIGLTYSDPKKELVFKSDTGNYYLGQSEQLSEFVGNLIETDAFFFPDDVGYDFLKQITNQFHLKKVDKYGGAKTLWVKGGNDHYRSCLNMSYAAAKILNLDTALFSEGIISTLEKAQKSKPKPEQPKTINHERPGRDGGANEYFRRALGRGRP
jgi:phage terminase large subunit GpA-like protein